ncbi:serine hydrolase family protein [bacterium]|jgi:uncharacterized protein|nr:serine hydrolase family protein [bacterium]MBT4122114.1 serine hydrolase family protein [bacterium]MBT4334964.1 serine hydrolase family protein [bacterium]MBT4495659.1 serine hydrolase family protein [bacterium]MBT4764323.1 serine hydrolase family protein [bacterium]
MDNKILVLPGISDAGPKHWQTLFLSKFDNIERVEQKDWFNPVCSDWVKELDNAIKKNKDYDIILLAHSLGCPLIMHWAQENSDKIKGAMLVAPADVDASSIPKEAIGFAPMPLNKLSFRTILVASTTDPYLEIDRAKHFAEKWGSEFINIGDHGHINPRADLGEWIEGEEILKKLL